MKKKKVTLGGEGEITKGHGGGGGSSVLRTCRGGAWLLGVPANQML